MKPYETGAMRGFSTALTASALADATHGITAVAVFFAHFVLDSGAYIDSESIRKSRESAHFHANRAALRPSANSLTMPPLKIQTQDVP